MSFDYLIALITIAWLIIGFVVLKLPGHICCPIGLAITIVLALFNWHMPVVSALTAALETIAAALAAGDRVQLVGFGTFETKDREARTGRNPRSKETIEIPASQTPVFKAGKALKDAVAK